LRVGEAVAKEVGGAVGGSVFLTASQSDTNSLVPPMSKPLRSTAPDSLPGSTSTPSRRGGGVGGAKVGLADSGAGAGVSLAAAGAVEAGGGDGEELEFDGSTSTLDAGVVVLVALAAISAKKAAATAAGSGKAEAPSGT
jgi:hypothetical protein